jgi:hypothetical protein
MSLASHVCTRLLKLYGIVLRNCRNLNWLNEHGIRGGRPPALAVMEACEPRLLMSNVPTIAISSVDDAAESKSGCTPGHFLVTSDTTAPSGGLTVNYSIGGTTANGEDLQRTVWQRRYPSESVIGCHHNHPIG